MISSALPRSLEDMQDTLRALQSLGSRPRTQVTVWFTPSYATRIVLEKELPLSEIRIKHECSVCHGTGLYSGYAERNGAAVVCQRCDGKGWEESVFAPFTGRKPKAGVTRVFLTNPGICIGSSNGYVLEDFGGMPVEDWLEGKPFPAGSEMRRFVCPRWWTQQVGPVKYESSNCNTCLGGSFRECALFNQKEKCWEDYERTKP